MMFVRSTLNSSETLLSGSLCVIRYGESEPCVLLMGQEGAISRKENIFVSLNLAKSRLKNGPSCTKLIFMLEIEPSTGSGRFSVASSTVTKELSTRSTIITDPTPITRPTRRPINITAGLFGQAGNIGIRASSTILNFSSLSESCRRWETYADSIWRNSS